MDKNKDKEYVVDYYLKSNKTMDQICNKFKCSYTSLNKWIGKYANTDSNKKVNISNMYAFVFAVFFGDAYIDGVLTVAYSIFRTGSKHDVVCMTTPDVSQDAKNRMKHIGIKVVDVPYIKTKGYLDERPNMKKRYPKIELFSTKWNCLNFTQYKKIFFLDADMLVQKNIDHIFNLPAPATRLALAIELNEVIYSAPYYKDGQVISKELGENIMYKKGGAIDGGCMLLEPNKDMYQKFLKFSENTDVRKFNARPGDDELYIYAFYHNNNINFHYLGPTWSCIFWKMEKLCSIENSYILNFIGTIKPWLKDLSMYDDLKPWYKIYEELKKKYPTLKFNKLLK
jgi:hypothetical protein